ncbi:MAG: dGTP triphosphohydrolase [Acidobacteriota bacterium]
MARKARNLRKAPQKRVKRKGSGSALSPQPSAKLCTREDRRHFVDRPDDQRNSFERDRDRVLYSSAFRRLAGVTQVVHVAEGHTYHNRLTHSLKVAQVARRLAEHIVNTESNDLLEEAGGINPDVVETSALAHDLGHPPFGHIAEKELDEQLLCRKVDDGYEGNAQTFRIVTKVSIRNRDHQGLNLTRASLNAILKYPWGRGAVGKKARKWGHYHSEREDFQFARALETVDEEHQSPEASIMDWADDITYSVHDVDDFYRAGLIPLDQLLLGTDERSRFIDVIFNRWETDEDYKTNLKVFNRKAAAEFFGMLHYLAKKELNTAFVGSRNQRARLNTLSAFLIRRYIRGPQDGAEAKAVTVVAPPQRPAVRIQPRLRAEVDLLKALMHYYVFDNPALVTQQYGQRRIIGELFEIYFKAIQPNSKNSNLVPYPFRDYLERIEEADDPELERARLVADLIASMTEQQAILLHQRLMGLAPGSVRDPIFR